MKSEVGPDGVLHLILGELSYNDFDKSGRISMWKLAKIVEGARHAVNRFGPLYNMINFKTSTIFIRTQSFKIHQSFYTDNLTQNHAVKINSYLTHLGRTSYCLDTDVYNLITNKLLASVSTHAVLVSQQTRRPTPFPTDESQFMNVRATPDKRPIPDPEFPDPPSMSFTHKRSVMLSDTDSNQHVNQAAYIRFCFDCAGKAALEGKLSSFTDDITLSDVKAMWILYAHEAKVGEELTLVCWEDQDCKRTIWVKISQESQVISQCQIELYGHEQKEFKSKSQKPLTVAKL